MAKEEEAADSEAIFEEVDKGTVYVDVLIGGGIDAMECFVLAENLPKRIVEVLVAKLIVPDGKTEKLVGPVGIVLSLEGFDLVGNNDFGVDGLSELDIERVVVGTEPYIVLDDLKVTVEVAIV